MFGSDEYMQRIKEFRKNFCHVVVTIKPPLSKDLKETLTTYWSDCCGDFVSIADNPSLKKRFLSDMKWSMERFNIAINDAKIQFFDLFPLVSFLIKKNDIDKLRRLPNVEYVHEIPQDYSVGYVNIIKGLHWCLEKKMAVVNMSLQPYEPYPFNEKEGINVATRILAENGITVVIAAGNFGNRRGNTLNPWSVAPWVIGVGAAHPDGKRLWEGSSKGTLGDPLYHPTVVAPGLDLVRIKNEKGVYNIKSFDKKYEKIDGTSYSTPRVTLFVTVCIKLINEIVKSSNFSEWYKTMKLLFGENVYPFIPSPYAIKKMIEDMAVEMPGYGKHEVGAGFINEDIAYGYYKNFNYTHLINIFVSTKGAEIIYLCIEFINELAEYPNISDWKNTLESKWNVKVCPITPSPNVIKRMIEDMIIEKPKIKKDKLGNGFIKVGNGYINKKIIKKYFKEFDFSTFIKIFVVEEGGE